MLLLLQKFHDAVVQRFCDAYLISSVSMCLKCYIYKDVDDKAMQ